MNICGIMAGESDCLVRNGMVCEYMSGNSYVAMIAEWVPGAGTWSTNSYGQATLSFSNGDICYPTPSPRTANMTFICDPFAPAGAVSVSQPPTDPCHYDIVVPTKYACGDINQVCGATANTFGNLTIYGTTLAAYYSATDAAGNTYYSNICGVMNGESKCAAKNGMVCMYDNTYFVAMLAAWDPSNAVWYTNSYGQPAVNFTNGDACWPNNLPRRLSMTFVCDPYGTVGQFTISQEAGNACNYDVVVPTKDACEPGKVTESTLIEAFRSRRLA